MELIISALTKTSDVAVVHRFMERHRDGIQHMRGMLVTPLMVTAGTLRRCRQLKDAYGVAVFFDSGGYAVQVGRLDYFEMYSRLIELYRRERWADLYTLPDHVPTSRDADAVVEAKVRQTVECSELFYREMPTDLQERALGVVHGRTRAHMEWCLDRYVRLGLRHVGFGSFGTAGDNAGVNVATGEAMANARAVCELARERGLTVHLFGVGAPAVLPWIWQTGASSYDSANWARGAGFGQVFLPLTRGYNITHRSASSEIQRGLTERQFAELRDVTGHDCEYCTSFADLQQSREARAMHNLMATSDSLDIIARGDTARMGAIYAAASPKYRSLWRSWIGCA